MIIQQGKKKTKKLKNEQSFRDLWDQNKISNNCIIGVLDEKEGETKKVHEEIMADTSQI